MVRAFFAEQMQQFAQDERSFTSAKWKFDLLFPWARAAGRSVTNELFIPLMSSQMLVAVRLLQCLATPVWSSSAELPAELDGEMLDRLHQIVDVDEMKKVLMESWIREELRKGPEDWPTMRHEAQILAQFWYYYQQWKARADRTTQAGEADSAAK
jgi:hypothetical protein